MKQQVGKNMNLVEAQNGVRDVGIIPQLFKNISLCCADVVFVKLQIHWDLKNLGD